MADVKHSKSRDNQGISLIYSYAWIGNEEDMVRGLWALLDHRADWSLPADFIEGYPAQRYGALIKCVKAAFARAYQEGLIVLSASRTLSAFDTGLRSVAGRRIFMRFTKRNASYKGLWSLGGFREEQCLDLDFSCKIPCLPFEAPCLDVAKPVAIDYDHVINRAYRLPADMFRGSAAVTEAFARLEHANLDAPSYLRHDLKNDVCHALKDEPAQCRLVRSEIKAAVAHSIALASRRAETAVAVYNPKLNVAHIALPLWLAGSDRANAAAILTDCGAYYQLETIYTVDMAWTASCVALGHKPWWMVEGLGAAGAACPSLADVFGAAATGMGADAMDRALEELADMERRTAASVA